MGIAAATDSAFIVDSHGNRDAFKLYLLAERLPHELTSFFG